MKKLFCLCLPFFLVACSTPPVATTNTIEAPASDAAKTPPDENAGLAGGQVGEAVTAPLRTLNLIKPDLPAALRRAAQAPYAAPDPLICDTIKEEVRALNAALGADLDAIVSTTSASLADKSSEAANRAAIGALRNAADGLVPYGSLVRQLSGANRVAREAADARAAGAIRRAYLKGLGQATKCEAPAPPLSEGRAPPQPAAPPQETAPEATSKP